MKKINASQVGMLLLVAMVMTRAFFVSDLNVFRGEGLGRLFSATLPGIIGYQTPELVDAGVTSPVGAIVSTQLEQNDANSELRESRSVVEEFNQDEAAIAGLADENEVPIELRLFTPSVGNELIAMVDQDEDEEYNDPEFNVAPLDGQNTITSQLNLLFPRGSQQ